MPAHHGIQNVLSHVKKTMLQGRVRPLPPVRQSKKHHKVQPTCESVLRSGWWSMSHVVPVTLPKAGNPAMSGCDVTERGGELPL